MLEQAGILRNRCQTNKGRVWNNRGASNLKKVSLKYQTWYIFALFQKEQYLPCEADDIEQSRYIRATLKLHKPVRMSISDDMMRTGSYFLSNGKGLCFT